MDRRVCIDALVGMEVEKLVLISGIYPTAVGLCEFLLLVDDRLCNQVSDLCDGEIPTFLGRIALEWGWEVVHQGALVDQI